MNNVNEKELRTKLEDCRRALFALRLDVQSAQVKDYSQFKKLRRSCAQILTALRQKELATHDARKQN